MGRAEIRWITVPPFSFLMLKSDDVWGIFFMWGIGQASTSTRSLNLSEMPSTSLNCWINSTMTLNLNELEPTRWIVLEPRSNRLGPFLLRVSNWGFISDSRQLISYYIQWLWDKTIPKNMSGEAQDGRRIDKGTSNKINGDHWSSNNDDLREQSWNPNLR